MPRIVSNPHENNSRHSGYHTNLLSNSHGVLERIATNTANINVNVGDVEINAADLEALTTATNAKLDAQKTVLDSMLIDTDAIDSSLNTIEAQSVLTASRLNNIQNSITADGAGGGNKLGVINTSILAKNTEIETSMNSLISANHTDLVALEASLTSMEGKQDSILSKNTENEALLTSIKTAVELLDNTVAGSELQVDIVSAPTLTVSGTVTSNLSATDNAVLDDMASKLDSIKTAVEVLDNTVSGSELQVDIVSAPTLTVSGTVTSNLSAVDNAVLDDMASKLDSIKTAVEVLDNTVSGSELQVDVVAALPAGTNKLGAVALKANESADGSGTERHLLCDSAGHLQVDVISSSSTTVNGTVTANLSATDNAVLDDMASKLDSIKTAVEVLDNAISGSELQVDVVASLPAGTNNIGDVDIASSLPAGDNNIGNVDIASALPAGDNNIGNVDIASSVALTVNLGATDNAVLDDMASKLNSIKTAVEVLDNAISGSEMQVDVVAALPAGDNNIGNVDIASALPAGTNNIGVVTANLSSTDNAVLDDMASKLDSIKTAVEVLDNAISGSEMQVDVVGALPAGTNSIGAVTLGAALPAGTNNIGDVDIASALPAGDNNIGNVDIASALPAGTNNIGVVTANLSATDNAVLDAIETTNNACQVLLGTIDADTNDIKTSVQLIDDVVKAEDAAHSSGDKGIMALAVHQTAGALLSANNDYTPLSVNVNQHLRTTQELQTFQFTLASSGSIANGNMSETDAFQFHHKVESSTIFVSSNNSSIGSFSFVLKGSVDGSAYFTISSSIYGSTNFNDNDKQAYFTLNNFNIKFIKLQVTNSSGSTDTFKVFVCA